MKNNLLFEFKADKTTSSVAVNKEFAAELPLVWDAFTKPEILDQWWAPKPWTSRTKFMNFEVGGRRFYAMVSPEGEEFWSIQDYTAIDPKTSFAYSDSFSDKDQHPNPDMPSSDWLLNFSEENGVTLVKMLIKHKSLADLEKILQMGFEGGFTMTLNDLESRLSKPVQQG